MGVERRPVHRGAALSAGPCSVAAAVPETGLMADEHLAGAPSGMPVRATRRRAGNPLPGRGLYQLAQHDQQPMCPVWPGSTANNTGLDPVPLWGSRVACRGQRRYFSGALL